MSFGVVKSSEAAVCKQYEIGKYPSVLAVKKGQKTIEFEPSTSVKLFNSLDAAYNSMMTLPNEVDSKAALDVVWESLEAFMKAQNSALNAGIGTAALGLLKLQVQSRTSDAVAAVLGKWRGIDKQELSEFVKNLYEVIPEMTSQTANDICYSVNAVCVIAFSRPGYDGRVEKPMHDILMQAKAKYFSGKTNFAFMWVNFEKGTFFSTSLEVYSQPSLVALKTGDETRYAKTDKNFKLSIEVGIYTRR